MLKVISTQILKRKKFDSMSTLTSLFGKFKCMALIMFMILTIGQLSWVQSTAN